MKLKELWSSVERYAYGVIFVIVVIFIIHLIASAFTYMFITAIDSVFMSYHLYQILGILDRKSFFDLIYFEAWAFFLIFNFGLVVLVGLSYYVISRLAENIQGFKDSDNVKITSLRGVFDD